jgi:hypothetical protein
LKELVKLVNGRASIQHCNVATLRIALVQRAPNMLFSRKCKAATNKEVDDDTSNEPATAPRSSVSSWIRNVQGRLLRAVRSGKPTAQRPKLQSPIIPRANTDMPAQSKAPFPEPAYHNCDRRLAPPIARQERSESLP